MNNIDINSLWESTSALPPEQRGYAFQTLLNRQAKPTDSVFETKLMDIFEKRMDPEFRRKELEDKLEFDRRSIAEAGKYKALFGLPSIVAQAAYAPAAIRARGTEQAANIISQNIGNMRMGQINPQVPLYGSVNYFG
jgi:hypothetical protein